MTMAVFKKHAIILHACAFLAAGSATSGMIPPVHDDTKAASARHVTVPIRDAYVSIQFDPQAVLPTAVVSYQRDPATLADQFVMTAEITPILSRVTGCHVAVHPTPSTPLISMDQPNEIALLC